MNPGDLVTLPSGQQAFYQRREPNGDLVVVVYVTVPASEAKKVKAVK